MERTHQFEALPVLTGATRIVLASCVLVMGALDLLRWLCLVQLFSFEA